MKAIKLYSNFVTLFLAVAGAILSFLLTLEHFFPQTIALPCTKSGGGCVGTLSSAYGHVGPIPTAAFGLAMYALLALLCFRRMKLLRAARSAQAAAIFAGGPTGEKSPAEQEAEAELGLEPTPVSVPSAPLPVAANPALRSLDVSVWGIALLGCGISIWLQYVALYVISSFCPYCFTSCCIVSLIFLLASRDAWLDGRAIGGEQKMLFGVGAFILAMVAFLYVPGLLERIGTIQHPPPNIAPHPVDSKDFVLKPGLHFKGKANARFTLVEFADYQCPHCALAAPVADSAVEMYPNDVRIAFRSFPLPMHKWARPAAQAAEAAGLQGKFWEMHDYLFSHQKEMEAPGFAENIFDDYARALGLDVAKFQKDRQSPEVIARVKADEADGTAAKVDLTPTFFFIVKDAKAKQFSDLAYLKNGIPDPKSDLWKF